MVFGGKSGTPINLGETYQSGIFYSWATTSALNSSKTYLRGIGTATDALCLGS